MLTRTPFKRKMPAPYVRPELEPRPNGKLTRPFNGARFDDVFVTTPKRDYIRSRVLLDACGLIPCQHCFRYAPGTVCAAHSNWSVHGKGGHIKADDNRVAALCSKCHIQILDQGSTLSQESRQRMWWSAHVRTVRQLLHSKLWLVGVPVPDIENYPFTMEPA